MTSDGRTVWRKGQDNAKKKAVWNEHKRLGLDETLRTILGEVEEALGPGQVDIIAIRERG